MKKAIPHRVGGRPLVVEVEVQEVEAVEEAEDQENALDASTIELR